MQENNQIGFVQFSNSINISLSWSSPHLAVKSSSLPHYPTSASWIVSFPDRILTGTDTYTSYCWSEPHQRISHIPPGLHQWSITEAGLPALAVGLSLALAEALRQARAVALCLQVAVVWRRHPEAALRHQAAAAPLPRPAATAQPAAEAQCLSAARGTYWCLYHWRNHSFDSCT